MPGNFRGSRKFARHRNCRKHKTLSRQARQVRKGPATHPSQFDLLTWRSLRALRETFLFLWLRLCRIVLFVLLCLKISAPCANFSSVNLGFTRAKTLAFCSG